MRKLLSIVAALAIVLSCCIMGVGTVASAAEEAPEADFMAFDGVLEEYIGAGGDVVIPASLGITEIAQNAFYENPDITSVVIPEGVEFIGGRAFQGCVNLETVELPYSLLEMGGNAFAYCAALTEITIPGRLEIIPSWAFADCKALKEIVFSYGVKEIHNQAFCSLFGTNIKKIVFPETIEIIACGAFGNQQDTKAVEYVICNPNCEIGLLNYTYQGNLDHKWEPDVYQTPFQSSYGVVTYKIVVPKDSNVAEFLKTKGEEMFAKNDETGHVDKFRVLEEKEEYFDTLAENQEDYGIQEPRTSATTDNPSDPETPGNDTQGDGTQGNGNNVNNNASNGAAADSGLVTTIIIAVVAVVIVIIICVVVVVILFATGKLGGKKKKPLTEEEMRAKILAETEEKKATEEAPAEDAE